MPPYVRGVTRRMLIRAFRRDGGWIETEGGRHTLMVKGPLTIAIPRHQGDIAPGTVGAIITQAGWTVERFRELARGRRQRKP